MHEESSVDSPSDKAFSENVTGSSSRHDLLEEVSLITKASGNTHRQRFWRRHLLPFCTHLFIFLIYSTLAFLALNSRSKVVQPKRNLLYCTFSDESASDSSDFSHPPQLLTDGSSCE